MTSRNEWILRMKEVLDANPEENDSSDLGDSWKGMPRRTEVLANRSNLRLYRRHEDPDILSAENPYKVVMVKGSTKVNAEEPKKQKMNVSPTENNDAVPAPSTSTPDNIVTEETSSKTFEETPALNFTDFIRSNNKTNIQITSTPYVVPEKAAVNRLPTNDHILIPEVPRTPKIPLLRTSFLNRNDDSYITPRSSRVSMNLINNSQLVSQSLRDAEREPHLNIIPENNKSSNGVQTGSAIVSSTVNSQDQLLTSDEDSKEQAIFVKPPEKIQCLKSQLQSTSSQNTIANKWRSQIYALQNDGQLSTDRQSNSTKSDKRNKDSRREVAVSMKEYMELMQTRSSNTQQSENATASTNRRKLYKKGDSINVDKEVDLNTVSSRQVFDVDGETNEIRTEVVIPPNKEMIDTRSSNKFERQMRSTHSKSPINRNRNSSETKRIIQPKIAQRSNENKQSPVASNDSPVESDIQPSNEVDSEKNKSQKRSVLSKPVILRTEQNGSEPKHVGKSGKGVGKKQLSKKSKKHSPFSKQSQVHSDQNKSKKSRKRPSEPEDTEQIVEPIPIDNQPDVEQLSNMSKKIPSPSDDMPGESQQDVFETSDIQPSNDIVVEKKSKSSKNQQNAKKQPLHVNGQQPKKSRRALRSNKKRTEPEEGESANDSNQETNEVKKEEVRKRKQLPKRKHRSLTSPHLNKKETYDPSRERDIVPGVRHSTRTKRLPEPSRSIYSILEKMVLKKELSHSRKNKTAATTSKALKKKVPSLDDIEEVDELRDEVIIPPNAESSQADTPPRKKKRPNETEHSTSLCSILLNDKLGPAQAFNFHGVRIGSGCRSMCSENLTAHYLPSFINGRSFGCMTINPNSTKASCRTIEEMWLMVMSGSTDLIVDNDIQTLQTGMVAQMQINTKYMLRNNSDHPAVVFFTQDTNKKI